MGQYTLTVVDTSDIQDYIFGTNNLQQNVGASYLVGCATREWMVKALPPTLHNVIDLDGKKPFTEQTIEEGELEAEVVYAGGGNAVILFADHDLAIDFARRLTHRVLLEAPGLQIVLVHKEFDWQNQPLGGKAGIVQDAMDALAASKTDRPASSPLLGLGVTAACVYTGLPAVAKDDEGRLISSEVKAKLDVESEASKRLKTLVDFGNYRPARDFDDFGRTEEESSYIAVVHTDGNDMSKRIQGIRDKFPTPEENREYVQAMRKFSLSVQRAALEALQNTVDKLVESVDERKVIGDVIELREDKLPFRPIVFGGDDVTFVCDGRLGLSLAAYYLEQFSGQRLADEEFAHCRAGIAVVKTHYPFARAYTLAEDLCKSAKKYIKERQQPPYSESGLTAMDWHFAVGGLVRELKELRKREYTIALQERQRIITGRLLMRPVLLTSLEGEWRTWNTLNRVTREFQAGEWAERRNKVKALRDALRAGPKAVEHFRMAYSLDKLPSIPEQLEMTTQGWQGGRCGYFDAIEAMDFFILLEGGQQL